MVNTSEVFVPGAQGQRMPAYLATPTSSEGPGPAVLVIHEILGLNDDIRRIARRFAEAGYVALAPDVFHDRGPKPICVVRTMNQIRRGHGPAVDDMLSVRGWLGDRDDVDGDRVGVAGFCMGGGFALLLGAIGEFKAAAPYYGDVRPDPETYRGLCPVVGGWGEKDRLFARKGRLLKNHLEQLGVTHDIEFYDDAGHSYMSKHAPWMMAVAPITPLHARYNEAAAEDSWRRMLAFFGDHI